MSCTDIQLKTTHLICSPGSRRHDFQPLPETRHKVADAMLRFSDPMTFNRTPGQMGRGEKGTEGMAGMMEGPVPFKKLSTGQWRERKGNSSFLVMDQKMRVDKHNKTLSVNLHVCGCMRPSAATERAQRDARLQIELNDCCIMSEPKWTLRSRAGLVVLLCTAWLLQRQSVMRNI